MRMAFGLVSVLVTLGIIILVMSMMLDSNTGSIPIALKKQDEARQISGRGMDGKAATESAGLRAVTSSSGRLESLLVTEIAPGGAYEAHFGLRVNDSITHINGMKVNDLANGDGSMAKALLSDAYARQWPITVMRDGRSIDLPMIGVAPVIAAAPTTAPAPPAAAPDDGRNPYRKQLDALRGTVN